MLENAYKCKKSVKQENKQEKFVRFGMLKTKNWNTPYSPSSLVERRFFSAHRIEYSPFYIGSLEVLIFSLYIRGLSVIKIVRYLEARSILSPRGKPTWSKHTIEAILENK
ncbi:MAG: recombinase family protein [Oscillospiraceae bacterium]|nr:recombinase family protein [Oscillospiraceae bacterium]